MIIIIGVNSIRTDHRENGWFKISCHFVSPIFSKYQIFNKSLLCVSLFVMRFVNCFGAFFLWPSVPLKQYRINFFYLQCLLVLYYTGTKISSFFRKYSHLLHYLVLYNFGLYVNVNLFWWSTAYITYFLIYFTFY